MHIRTTTQSVLCLFFFCDFLHPSSVCSMMGNFQCVYQCYINHYFLAKGQNSWMCLSLFLNSWRFFLLRYVFWLKWKLCVCEWEKWRGQRYRLIETHTNKICESQNFCEWNAWNSHKKDLCMREVSLCTCVCARLCVWLMPYYNEFSKLFFLQPDFFSLFRECVWVGQKKKFILNWSKRSNQLHFNFKPFKFSRTQTY